MTPSRIRIESCRLNLGELHRLSDPGYFSPEFVCRAADGQRFEARMRLHVTEPLEPLLIVDPRDFADAGYAANSAGSTVLPRRASYAPACSRLEPATDARVYALTSTAIQNVLLRALPPRPEVRAPIRGVGVTCHDPQQVGGGNTILFRYINWLAELGVRTTVYSCGAAPTWTRVEATFRRFDGYDEMCAAMDEDLVVLFSMWHIEPLLRASRRPRRIVALRQIAEPMHYGQDWVSACAGKPVIDLLESLPLDCITVSPHLRDHYTRLGVQSRLVTNGIDLSTFRPRCSSERERRRDGPVRVLSVGDPRHFVKGAPVLAEALTRLSSARPELRFEWIIAGGEEHAPLPFTPPANVTVTRRSCRRPEDMRALYGEADVFVNCSWYEGFGLPTLEAMACGIPVVHADNRGLDGLVSDGHDCRLFEAGNAAALGRCLAQVAVDEVTNTRLSEAGVSTARRHGLVSQFDAFVAAWRPWLNGLDDALATAIRAELAREERHATLGADALAGDPVVSVVVPTYNQARYLGAALDSLIAQTDPRWEAVVVNDGSTDDTAEVLAAYAARDARIRPVTTVNRGITAALNEGLRHARGRFFCWLSSDDLFYPDKLRLQIDAFDRLGPEHALVYGSFDFLSDEDGSISSPPHQQPVPPGMELAEALRFDYIDGCSAMVRMSALRRAGGFNAQYRHSQDMELWMRLASRGYRFHLVPHKVSIRRIHAAQSSSTNMIHCRYDAAAMVDYYLTHFTLLEVYRSCDPTRPEQVRAMVDHAISRTLHAEANVNHPLLRRKFWQWLSNGLASLPGDASAAAAERCISQLIANREACEPVREYLEWALASGERSGGGEVRDRSFTVDDRDITRATRATLRFADELFEYALGLLVDPTTPRFAQELTFHGVNRLVGTPARLAHSALRYLGQFENPCQARVTPHLQAIPESVTEGVRLFCRLCWPDLSDAFEESLDFDPNRGDLQRVATAERRIAAMNDESLERLRRTCQGPLVEPLFHYWHALTLAERGEYPAAIASAKRTRVPGANRDDSRVDAMIEAWRALVAGGRVPSVPSPGVVASCSAGQEPRLRDVRLQPYADGTYALASTVKSARGVPLRGRVVQPYSASLEALTIAAPNGEAVTINREELLAYWTSMARPAVGARRERWRPAIAFTVLNASGVGGGPAIVCRYAGWLAELGVDVTIYGNSDPPSGLPSGVRYRQHVNDEARYGAIDEPVVVIYSATEIPQALEALRGRGCDLFHLCQGLEDHNYGDGRFDDLLAPKPIFDLLHAVPLRRIVVSDHLASYFAGRDPHLPLLIPNGIDLNVFRPGAERPMTGEIHVLTVGAPERPLKGAADVRDALALVAQRRPAWRLHLHIVGGHGVRPDGVADPDRVTVSYEQIRSADRMAAAYRDADVLVNAAWYEGFGLPSLEAMACGVPVIQADNRGLEGLVVDGENCLIVPPHDPERLAAAIVRGIEDRALRDRVRGGGLRTAACADLVRQFDAFVPVFEQVLSGHFAEERVAAVRKALAPDSLGERIDSWRRAHEPIFSVLVPAYNHAKFLPAALDSLLAQTYPHWQAIVVDDGSSDETPEVLAGFASRDPRFRIVRQANGGVGSALNAALERATGDWICWLSADDLFEPTALEIHRRAIGRHPGARAFYSGFAYLDDINGRIEAGQRWQPDPDVASQVSRFLTGPYIHGNSIAVERSVFDEAGRFDSGFAWGQDFDMWLRIAAVTRWQPLTEQTCVTRLHEAQGTRQFPEGGGLDAAVACARFLNAHPLPAVYPALDLSEPENARRAVRDALAIANSRHAALHRLGWNHVLLHRVIEWVRTVGDCPARPLLMEELRRFLFRAGTGLEPASRVLVSRTLDGDADGWSFEPIDPLTLAHRRLGTLREAGEKQESEAIERYLERWPKEPGGETGTVRPAAASGGERVVAPPSPATTRTRNATMTNPTADAVFRLDHVKTVAIFGAGRFGTSAAQLASRCGWTIGYWVDNNAKLWNTNVAGRPVRPAAALRESPVDLIVIASHANLDAIARQLEGLGFVHGVDFISFLAPVEVGDVQLRVTA